MSLHRPGIDEQAKKKQCSLIKGKQSISEEDADIDRISSLPKDVIDLILGFLPTQDAARTCVLSSKWRYVWANHPILFVDEEFWESMKPRFRGSRVDFGTYTVNRMFIHHSGQISKFGLDISVGRHCDVDLWLSLVSRRGVKVLVLENSSETPYTLPSCVLSNSNLTELWLFDGFLKTVKSSTALHKLESLYLVEITLSSWVLVTPLLSSLTLDGCRDTRQFIISAPRLVSLTLDNNDDLNLVPYLTCSDIECVRISVSEELEHHDGKSIKMMKLLSFWPKISKFSLTGSSIKYLARGIVHEEFPVLNLKRLVGLYIDFNIDQLASILCILRNSRLLQIFDIQLKRNATNDLEVVNYLEELNIVNLRMEQLRVVKMKYLTAARAELLFMKILLQSAPSLKRMLVEEDEDLDLSERLRISKELMRLQRQFPNAEIIFEPNLISFDSMRI